MQDFCNRYKFVLRMKSGHRSLSPDWEEWYCRTIDRHLGILRNLFESSLGESLVFILEETQSIIDQDYGRSFHRTKLTKLSPWTQELFAFSRRYGASYGKKISLILLKKVSGRWRETSEFWPKNTYSNCMAKRIYASMNCLARQDFIQFVLQWYTQDYYVILMVRRI